MNPTDLQLYDIEGLDPISWWPLAIGWWFMLAALIATALVVFGIYRLQQYRSQRWQRSIRAQLSELNNALTEENTLATAQQLSELIRRIAMQQYSRKECAGLTGRAWLLWLQEHDPKRFDWPTHGDWLQTVVYAPKSDTISKSKLQLCITAMQKWVK